MKGSSLAVNRLQYLSILLMKLHSLNELCRSDSFAVAEVLLARKIAHERKLPKGTARQATRCARELVAGRRSVVFHAYNKKATCVDPFVFVLSSSAAIDSIETLLSRCCETGSRRGRGVPCSLPCSGLLFLLGTSRSPRAGSLHDPKDA